MRIFLIMLCNEHYLLLPEMLCIYIIILFHIGVVVHFFFAVKKLSVLNSNQEAGIYCQNTIYDSVVTNISMKYTSYIIIKRNDIIFKDIIYISY